MKKLVNRLVTFVRNVGGCMAAANRDSDTWYHIPKSRFNGGAEERRRLDYLSDPVERPAKNYFLGSFRDCLLSAWKASDRDYHIPKSRFQDPGFNQSAYRPPPEPGLLRHVTRFLGTLSECVRASWEASDTFYHLPRSRYQKAEYIRELMNLAPVRNGKLLYRPYTIGSGFVRADEGGRGWTIEDGKKEPGEPFFFPQMAAGAERPPEVEM